MTSPTLLITPRRPALLSGFDNTVDLLLRLQAHATPPAASERSPLNLAIVLDRSGSMQGQPVEEAKRCVGMIVDRLGTGDGADARLECPPSGFVWRIECPAERVSDHVGEALALA